MSTRISKSVALNAIAVVSMLLAAVLNIFVIERFVAGVAMLYKFAFEWPAPIYMSLSTVMLFVAVVCVLAVGNRMCSAMFRDVTPQTVRRFQVANMIHLISVGTLVVMWLGKIAILQ